MRRGMNRRPSVPRWLGWSLACFLSVAGCRVGPGHCVPVVNISDEWSQELPEGVTDAPPDETWWEAFDDPILRGLISKTREQNLTLQESAWRIAEARAMRGIARGGLFPDIDGIGSYSRLDFSDNGTAFGISGIPFPPFDFWSTGFDSSWEIDVFGRVRNTISAADADIDVAEQGYNQLLVTLLGDVASSYMRIRTLQQRVRFASENLRIQEESLRIARARFDAGAVSELDVAQARSNLQRTKAAIPLLEREIKRASNRLCVLMGEAPYRLERDLAPQADLPDPPEPIGVSVPANLLRQRPDVLRAERELAAQASRVGIAVADLYPRLSLVGVFTVDSTEFRTWFTTHSVAYRFGPAVRWNLLDFGRARGNVRLQKARWEQAAIRYEQTVLQAVEEVESALASLIEDRKSAEALGEAVTAAREASQLAQRQYTEGAVNFQSLLDAQRFQTELEDRYAETRGELLLSVVALYKALGGGWNWEEFESAIEALPNETVPAPEGATSEGAPILDPETARRR